LEGEGLSRFWSQLLEILKGPLSLGEFAEEEEIEISKAPSAIPENETTALMEGLVNRVDNMALELRKIREAIEKLASNGIGKAHPVRTTHFLPHENGGITLDFDAFAVKRSLDNTGE
jgi:hypothetical protein